VLYNSRGREPLIAVDPRCPDLRRCPASSGQVIEMAYDDALAARVRLALTGRIDVVEKAMFGGVTFMVAGNMCCGVNRNDLIIRLDGHIRAEDLGSPHVRPWDFMKRPMPGIFAVEGAGCANQSAVDPWIELALKHALSLPPKIARASKKTATMKRKGRK
jgi:TfoX/Sxy family transcriptional regulator of competence genes